ncbi:hypothetical protein N0V90_013450 [Kalmusia sp. IMI 367209]|nr:hypothetical protein N0V90_013450 [Kalmusia sp. IMI 367209]
MRHLQHISPDFSTYADFVPADALANHGFLPRDGKNITQDVLVKGTAAVNLTTEVAIGLFLAALKTSSDPASHSFTLQDLKKHNFIEHDGSLSRADTGTPGANDQQFNRGVFSEFKSFFQGATQISLPLAATARWGRIKSAKGSNPAFVYGPAQRFNSYAETAVYYQLLVDPKTGTVPLNFLDVFFCEERLPVREGWRVQTSISGLGSASVILQLAMATDEKAADLVLPPSRRGFSHLGETVL